MNFPPPAPRLTVWHAMLPMQLQQCCTHPRIIDRAWPLATRQVVLEREALDGHKNKRRGALASGAAWLMLEMAHGNTCVRWQCGSGRRRAEAGREGGRRGRPGDGHQRRAGRTAGDGFSRPCKLENSFAQDQAPAMTRVVATWGQEAGRRRDVQVGRRRECRTSRQESQDPDGGHLCARFAWPWWQGWMSVWGLEVMRSDSSDMASTLCRHNSWVSNSDQVCLKNECARGAPNQPKYP